MALGVRRRRRLTRDAFARRGTPGSGGDGWLPSISDLPAAHVGRLKGLPRCARLTSQTMVAVSRPTSEPPHRWMWTPPVGATALWFACSGRPVLVGVVGQRMVVRLLSLMLLGSCASDHHEAPTALAAEVAACLTHACVRDSVVDVILARSRCRREGRGLYVVGCLRRR